MGTSLSGLTPATTFDGLLKTSDNEPLDGTLKPISTGDGTDTMLELSTSALQIGGATGMYWDNTNKRLGINNTSPAAPLEVNGEIRSTSLIRLMIGGSNKVLMQNANTVINSDVAIGQAAAPSARLHIKGSGATFATTSLLVQNSAGTNAFEVKDNQTAYSYGGLYSSITRVNYINTYNNAYSVMQTHQGDGNASFHQSVAVGQTTTPTARLHVKGSGNTNTTTSLLVQNSDGTNALSIGDDRTSIFWANANLKGDTYGNAFYLTPAGNLKLGEQAPASARLHIKGSGATSATTALLVQNSAGTEHLKVTDDGNVNIRQNLFVNHPSVSSRKLRLDWGSIYAEDNSSELSIGAVYSQNTSPRITLGGKTRSSGADAILVQTLNGMYIAPTASAENPSAQLQVKGSGATSATTALLVENSAGTDLLKVVDDGQLEIKSNSGRVSTTSGTSIFSYTSGGGGVLDVNPSNGNSVKFRARGDNDTFLIQTNPAGDNVGIGASSPDSTAKLQVDSTTQGFLPPRMTTTERDAISTPAAGLMVYNTTTNKAQCYNGTAWQDLF